MFISCIDSTTNEELFDRLEGLHIEDVNDGNCTLTIKTTNFDIFLNNSCKWDTILFYIDCDKPIKYKYDKKKQCYMGPCIEAIKIRMNPRSPASNTNFTYEQSRIKLAEIIRYLMVA